MTAPVNRSAVTMTIKNEELHVYPPRDAEEANTRGVFVSGNGHTYAHFNGTLSSGVLGTPGTTGLVHCYADLADKLGELLLAQVKQAKSKKQRQLTIIADANVEITPVHDRDGVITGNNISMKLYGFEADGLYYTTKGGVLTVTERAPRAANVKESKVSFF